MKMTYLLFVGLWLSASVLHAEEKRKPAALTIAPTYSNVAYGDHPRNVLDFWAAAGNGPEQTGPEQTGPEQTGPEQTGPEQTGPEQTGPRPLLVYIHGGGWVVGGKKRGDADIKPFLDRGISYAAINYRLTDENPLPAPVHDAARAIQFIRSQAEQWNIRKDRIALTGGSAGACTSMWLLCHDDLADPDSSDPVERESSRVTAAAVTSGQTSIDPKVIEPWLGPNVLQHRMINMAVGEATIEGAITRYDEHQKLYIEFSPFNHVSSDDPPLLMTYGRDMTLPSKDSGHGIHHPVYGVKMKEKADSVGQECHLIIPGTSSSRYKSTNEFLIEKLLL